MTLIRWSPLRRAMSLRDAMDRIFSESLARSYWDWPEGERTLSVPIDMYETDDHLVVRSDLPGLKPEEVDISITGDTLTIKGEFRSEEEERGDVYMQERCYGRFQRSVALPTGVDSDAAEATFEDGVLKVTLPKAEEAKPKQITVQTGA
ncbi:MAG: Hsp20/alpha crystallin family protein [Chloroflexia bacterium]|nr:Hsp20/alpha crystallin family protein [Chloroflexia bacterium]